MAAEVRDETEDIWAECVDDTTVSNMGSWHVLLTTAVIVCWSFSGPGVSGTGLTLAVLGRNKGWV